MPSILDHFDALTEFGLKIIPLRANSKVPLCEGWTRWDRDHARSRLQVFPDCNIGILLGEIVDVEGDSDEANKIIADLIGDYVHPMYQSTKSVHHLFLTPDPKLRHFGWNRIEFRGWGHQSVLPPSQHEGVTYTWQNRFKFPVPPMPDSLVEFLKEKTAKQIAPRPTLQAGHVKVWCAACENACTLHEKRFKLEIEAFRFLGQKWTCHSCRTFDLRPACRMIRSGSSKEAVLKKLMR